MRGPDVFKLQAHRVGSGHLAQAQESDPDWTTMWHGMAMLKTSFSSAALQQHQTLLREEPYSAYALETYALLSVMACYPGEAFVFMELGSGRAPWCLTVAGVIAHGLIPAPPRSCFTLALEAEPAHYVWSKLHLQRNRVRSLAVHGAIGAKHGHCRFQTSPDPAAHMGQHVSVQGDIAVPLTTIDRLIDQASLKHVHAVHMDVQGQEVAAIQGAREALRAGRIDFFIIGTHGPELEQELKSSLASTHELVVELPMRGQTAIPGFEVPFHSADDGVHVYRRKRQRQ